MPANTDTFSASIVSAVRAEMGRRSKKLNELVAPLGLSWPTISARLNGHYPFTSEELDKIAAFLDMTPYDLIESARFGQRFNEEKPLNIEAARITPPHDPWPQPSRSKRRA